MPPAPKPEFGSKALFGGDHRTRTIEGWTVSWESLGSHRLWCHQTRENAQHLVCVVMFNPGSLSGDGSGLSKDDTLRIIRSATPDGTSTLVLNLFTLATPKPPELFNQWDARHHDDFDITAFHSLPIRSVVYAYGDGGQSGTLKRRYGPLVRSRIKEIRTQMEAFPEAALPKELVSTLGNPKHPKHWKLLKQIDAVKAAITASLQDIE